MTHTTAVKRDRIELYEQLQPSDTMAADVHTGLSRKQKTLPPKYFYDKRGSELFDAITNLPEYYPARTEIGLLRQHVHEVAELLGMHSFLMELGSGSSVKIRLLLEAIRPKVYVPMDISHEHLVASTQCLASDYPWLTIHAVCIDYSRPWNIPNFGAGRYNVFFPGSSISNLDPVPALQMLQQIRCLVGSEGGLLIGVDLKKDVSILEAAYNDAQGVTADFNLNILAHINQRLNAEFDLGNFTHKAIYNACLGRIEMYLVCNRDHHVHINGSAYYFKSGETIHTENSYKYSIDEFHDLAEKADFAPSRVWTDEAKLFSIHYYSAS